LQILAKPVLRAVFPGRVPALGSHPVTSAARGDPPHCPASPVAWCEQLLAHYCLWQS